MIHNTEETDDLDIKRRELCGAIASQKSINDIANLLVDRIAIDEAFIDDKNDMYDEESQMLTLSMQYCEASGDDRATIKKELLECVNKYIAEYGNK